MTIETVFDPPLSTDSPAVFAVKAFDTMAKLNPFAEELNALTVEINGDLEDVAEMVPAAQAVIDGYTGEVLARRNTAINTEIPAAVGQVTEAVAQTYVGQAGASATAAAASAATATAASNSAYVNADVYASTAAGLAAVALGDQFQVVSADGLTMLRYRHDAGPVATLVASYPTKAVVDEITETVKLQDDGVSDKLMRFYDQARRLLLDLDADPSTGLTLYQKLNFLAGTVPFAALDDGTKERIPVVPVSSVVGYLARFYDANRRLAIGIPTDARQPIEAYVTRAATADSGGAVVAETALYYVEAFADGAGVPQLRARRKIDNQVTWTTSGAASTSPSATPDGWILYAKNGVVYSVDPAVGFSYLALPTTDLVLYGDSMTAPGSGYGDALAALYPGRVTINQGQGGARTAGICLRFGVPGLTLAVAGNAIPTSGSVSCTPNNGLLPGTGTNAIRVSVGGVECDLAAVSGAYSLTPVVYPSSPVALANPAPAVALSARASGSTSASLAPRLTAMQQGVFIIRAGRNDVDKSDYSQSDTLAWIVAAVDAVKSRAKAVLVLGVTNGPIDLPESMGGSKATEAASDLVLSNIAALNAALASTFGPRYLDPLANHVALGGATSRTVNGNTYQVLNSTFISDGIHENSTGWANTAALVQSAINSKGY